MGLIDKEEAARRLARVILSDIELYNTEKIRLGLDLRREINDGYRLFRSRVAPELVSVFAEAVAQKSVGGNRSFVVPPEALSPTGSTPRPFSTTASSVVHHAPASLMSAGGAMPSAASMSPSFDGGSLSGPELSRGRLSKVRLLTAVAALVAAGFLVNHFLAR